MSRQINVGGVLIGGGAPVSIQTMTNTKTENVRETLEQIRAMKTAGADIVRCAVPTMEAAAAIAQIKEQVDIPIVADIHFDYRLAVEAAEAGADKIRINPGNIGSDEKVQAVVDACKKKKIPIRIGVNGGSLPKEILKEYGVTARGMVECAKSHISILERMDFKDICVSIKASDVIKTIEAYRIMHAECDYPLHVGITEAGTEYQGIIKSAVGIGALLAEGVGDTIRVSLTADPVKEVRAGMEILKALNLRKQGVRIISCPTCGRTESNLIELAERANERFGNCAKDVTIAVMGCAVNGPGEAREADFGVACGKDEGVIFVKGEILKKVPYTDILNNLEKIMEEF